MEVDGAGEMGGCKRQQTPSRLPPRGRIEQVRGELVTPKVATHSFVFIPCTSTNTGKRVIIIHGT